MELSRTTASLKLTGMRFVSMLKSRACSLNMVKSANSYNRLTWSTTISGTGAVISKFERLRMVEISPPFRGYGAYPANAHGLGAG